MERNERMARIRSMAWRTLEALDVLMEQVRDPQMREKLRQQRIRLLERLKQDHY